MTEAMDSTANNAHDLSGHIGNRCLGVDGNGQRQQVPIGNDSNHRMYD